MVHYSDNPVWDAQDYLRSIDEREDVLQDPDYTCVGCDEGFYSNQNGVLVDEETFCKNCIKKGKHLEYFESLELTTLEYNKSINKQKPI